MTTIPQIRAQMLAEADASPAHSPDKAVMRERKLIEALTVAASRMEVASVDWGISAALATDKLTHADDMAEWAKDARDALAALATKPTGTEAGRGVMGSDQEWAELKRISSERVASDVNRMLAATATPPVSPTPDSTGPAGADLGEPVVWVVPGNDTANCNGYVDAMCVQEGEFTRPLYAAPQILATLNPSALIAAPVLEAWRSMETHPRDEKPVRIMTKDGRILAAYWSRHPKATGGSERYPWVTLDETNGTNGLTERVIAGWLPLAPTPASDVPGEAQTTPDSTAQGDGTSQEGGR